MPPLRLPITPIAIAAIEEGHYAATGCITPDAAADMPMLKLITIRQISHPIFTLIVDTPRLLH